MIVSLHVTHVSAGNICGLNEIIPELEQKSKIAIESSDIFDEYIFLRTCNRFEVYTSTMDPEGAKKILSKLMKETVSRYQNDKIAFILEDGRSVKHLFRVICGLDSMIVGEDQIQHQIRDSYIQARTDRHANKQLAYLFDHALIVGKRVRSETALNKGAVSVGSAAVELAEQRIGSLEGKSIAIIGAGDMAGVIAKNLAGKGPKAVIVSNRTLDHARELAGQLNGTAVTLDNLQDVLRECDLALVATSAPHVVVRKPLVEESMIGRKRKLLIIDVSVPRNVADDVADVHDVDVATMDSLNSIAMENIARRTAEITDAEHIINEELKKMDNEQKEKIANDIIRRLSLKFTEIKDDELSQAKARAIANPDINSILEDLSRALVGSMTSELFIKLREASRMGQVEVCRTAESLFGIEEEKK